MQINKLNSFTAFGQSNNRKPVNTFRDDELFDRTKDKPDYYYKNYGDNGDVFVSRPAKNPICREYRADYLDSYKDNYCDINKDLAPLEIDPIEIKVDCAMNYASRKANLGAKMLKACSFMQDGERVYSDELVKTFEKMNKKDDFSHSELMTLMSSAKLVQENGDQRFSKKLFDRGVSFVNSNLDNKDVKSYMRACVLRDKFGGEYYSQDMMDFVERLRLSFYPHEIVLLSKLAITTNNEGEQSFDRNVPRALYRIKSGYQEPKSYGEEHKTLPNLMGIITSCKVEKKDGSRVIDMSLVNSAAKLLESDTIFAKDVPAMINNLK